MSLIVLWWRFYGMKSLVKAGKIRKSDIMRSLLTYFLTCRKITTKKNIRNIIVLVSRTTFVWKWKKKMYHVCPRLTFPHQIERKAKVRSKMWFWSVAWGIQQEYIDLVSSSKDATQAFSSQKTKPVTVQNQHG